MLPTQDPSISLGSPKRPPSATKSIRTVPNIAEDLSTGRNRYTSVLYSSLPQALSSSAAIPTARQAPPLLPRLAARISAAPNSPPTSRDSFIMSPVLEDLTESDIPDLASLPSSPTWVPEGVSLLSFLKTSLHAACAISPNPFAAAAEAYQVLSAGLRHAELNTLHLLPPAFSMLTKTFPDDTTFFWSIMRKFLQAWLSKFSGAVPLSLFLSARGPNVRRRPDAVNAAPSNTPTRPPLRPRRPSHTMLPPRSRNYPPSPLPRRLICILPYSRLRLTPRRLINARLRPFPRQSIRFSSPHL